MKPFLLLSIRPEQAAADNEYESFLRFTGLEEAELPLINLAQGELPDLDLDEWSGILLGGGPWNASDPPETKSPAQLRSEVDDLSPARQGRRARLRVPRRLLRHRHPRACTRAGWSTAAGRSRSVRCR